MASYGGGGHHHHHLSNPHHHHSSIGSGGHHHHHHHHHSSVSGGSDPHFGGSSSSAAGGSGIGSSSNNSQLNNTTAANTAANTTAANTAGGQNNTGTGSGGNNNNKDDSIKSCFLTREGTYKLMTLSEYSRPNRVPLNPQGGGNNIGSVPVRVSFLTLNPQQQQQQNQPSSGGGGGSTADSPNENVGGGGALLNRGGGGHMDTGGYGASGSMQNSGGYHGGAENVEPDIGGRLGGGSGPNDSIMDPFCPDRICFNVGREVYVYHYRGVRNAADLSKPIDKRVYKGTFPTCHDFNSETSRVDSCNLIIGFSAGQIQMIDPFSKDPSRSKLFNEERLIDKTKVSTLKWIPGSPKQFLAAHYSGNLYVYNQDLPCGPGAPVYQVFKSGPGYTIYTCKTKSNRNPTFRWQIGEGPLHEFQFSPDNKLLATCSQDGYMRIFSYHSMELVGQMRSYFGGLLTVGWSPDGKYLVTGGEDDLVTVYSVQEKRIVCRGQGHKSWISQVAFDPYTTLLGEGPAGGVPVDLGSEEDLRPSSYTGSGAGGMMPHRPGRTTAYSQSVGSRDGSFTASASGGPGLLRRGNKASVSSTSLGSVCYRFGSVGHDTQLCLWDLTEDVLKQPTSRHRVSVVFPQSPIITGGGGGNTTSGGSFTLPPILSSSGGSVSVAAADNHHENNINNSSSTATLAAASNTATTPLANATNTTSAAAASATNSTMNNGSSTGGGAGAGGAGGKDTMSDKKENSGKKHKRGFSFGSKLGGGRNSSDSGKHQQNSNSSSSNKHSNHHSAAGGDHNHSDSSSKHGGGKGGGDGGGVGVKDESAIRLLGTAQCPRLDEVPMIEPLVCKKIAHERLTVLSFREDCIVTACQEGFICTWARPGKSGLSHQQSINSPNPGGSPNLAPGITSV